MKFRVLGSVEVWRGGEWVEVRGSKACTFLATLLMSYNRVVPDSRLVDMLWGESPPMTTPAQIQIYASRLRALLDGDARIERQPPGYRIGITPETLDLARFEQLADQAKGRLAECDLEGAAALFREALALWRGPALAGVTDHLAAVEQPWLEEARLAVLEDCIDAELALGRHSALISELTALTADQPSRERPRAQLMLALHRCGREADALAVYQRYRDFLAEELGLDPSRRMAEIHRAILAADPALLDPDLTGAVLSGSCGTGPAIKPG